MNLSDVDWGGANRRTVAYPLFLARIGRRGRRFSDPFLAGRHRLCL